MYTDYTKITELTVKELKEIIRTEVALLVPNKTPYDYSKVYTTTKTNIEPKPVYPDPYQTPYC